MQKVAFAALCFALLGARPSAAGEMGSGVSEELSTDRRIAGVITAIEPSALTIAGPKRAVTARIDPTRTKVTVSGRPGKIADLKLTAHAKGEVCLDDVWIAIDAR